MANGFYFTLESRDLDRGHREEARRPPDPCLLPSAAAPSYDEDLVQWELHAQCARQELLPNGGVGRLACGQELYCFPFPQWPF